MTRPARVAPVVLTLTVALGAVAAPDAASHDRSVAATPAAAPAATPAAAPAVATRATIPVGVSFGNSLLRLDGAGLDRVLDQLVAMHATWLRMDMAWSDLQPVDAEHWSWAATDRVVKGARARGLHVLGLLTYTPPWARADGCRSIGCPPRSDAAFASYAQQVVDRYEPEGVGSYEIWNEPNLPLFWTHPDPAAYSLLLQQTAQAIRSRHPATTLLFGGLAALPTSGQTISASQFLAGACRTGRCAGVSAVSYHPYTFPRLASENLDPLSSWQRMTRSDGSRAGLQSVMKQVGLGARKIWVTEYGAPTGGRLSDPRASAAEAARVVVTPAKQAAILVDGLRLAQRQRALVGGYFVHTWTDQTTDGTIEDHFGLRTTTGAAKPAYDALRRELAPQAVARTPAVHRATPVARKRHPRAHHRRHHAKHHRHHRARRHR